MNWLRIILVLVFFLFSCGVFAQTNSQIFLINEEKISGEVLLVTDEYILLKQDTSLRSIQRDSIQFQISSSRLSRKRTKSPRMILTPIDKRFPNEVDAGLTFGMPFALRIGYTKWGRIGEHWLIGIGTSMQFYRYTMYNGSINLRWLIGQDRFIKPFLESGFGMSYVAYVNGLNFRPTTGASLFPPNYKSEFGSVKQFTVGPGLWMDTGLGVVFTSRLLYNATWYTQTEYPTTTYYIRGEYIFSSASLQLGFIF